MLTDNNNEHFEQNYEHNNEHYEHNSEHYKQPHSNGDDRNLPVGHTVSRPDSVTAVTASAAAHNEMGTDELLHNYLNTQQNLQPPTHPPNSEHTQVLFIH